MYGIRTIHLCLRLHLLLLGVSTFIVKILGQTLVLRRLLSFSRNGNKIITATSISISSLLRVSQYLLSFQKLCQPKHDYPTSCPFKNDFDPSTILIDQN